MTEYEHYLRLANRCARWLRFQKLQAPEIIIERERRLIWEAAQAVLTFPLPAADDPFFERRNDERGSR